MNCESLNAPFSTADADNPSLQYLDGDLRLGFIDWQEKQVSIRFPKAAAFCWQQEAQISAEVRDDTSYEVVDSPWRAELTALGAIEPSHRHYKLCFNACGVLDVISFELVVES